MKKLKLLTLFVTVIFAMSMMLSSCKKKESNIEPSDSVVSQAIGSVIEYKGSKYIYNTQITNILFLGIDNKDPLNEFSATSHAGQSDAIFVLSLNNETKEASFLQVNRNSMTDIDIYNNSGVLTDTIRGQVTLQYAYGTGGTQSCWASTKTISEMLCDLPIDAYFTMNIDGINKINDAVGGVDIEMPKDYTNIDPSMKMGETVHIEGAMAERFVRYRNLNEFNSVADRMDRQILYISALLDVLCSKNTMDLYDIISPYLNDIILTNMEPDELRALGDYTYSGCEVDLLPGEMVDTDTYEEYHLDDEALEELIVKKFYVPYH